MSTDPDTIILKAAKKVFDKSTTRHILSANLASIYDHYFGHPNVKVLPKHLRPQDPAEGQHLHSEPLPPNLQPHHWGPPGLPGKYLPPGLCKVEQKGVIVSTLSPRVARCEEGLQDVRRRLSSCEDTLRFNDGVRRNEVVAETQVIPEIVTEARSRGGRLRNDTEVIGYLAAEISRLRPIAAAAPKPKRVTPE